jgi:hypothetical protein
VKLGVPLGSGRNDNDRLLDGRRPACNGNPTSQMISIRYINRIVLGLVLALLFAEFLIGEKNSVTVSDYIKFSLVITPVIFVIFYCEKNPKWRMVNLLLFLVSTLIITIYSVLLMVKYSTSKVPHELFATVSILAFLIMAPSSLWYGCYQYYRYVSRSDKGIELRPESKD